MKQFSRHWTSGNEEGQLSLRERKKKSFQATTQDGETKAEPGRLPEFRRPSWKSNVRKAASLQD